jgi:hypothetical protein
MSDNPMPKFGRMLIQFGVSALVALSISAGLRLIFSAAPLFAGLIGIAVFFIAIVVVFVAQSVRKEQPAKVSKEDAQVYGIDDRVVRDSLAGASKNSTRSARLPKNFPSSKCVLR